MSISEVLQKIECDDYDSKEECADDVRLIWSNSILYNAPGSRIYNAAKSLSVMWENSWKEFSPENDMKKPLTKEEMKQWMDYCML